MDRQSVNVWPLLLFYCNLINFSAALMCTLLNFSFSFLFFLHVLAANFTHITTTIQHIYKKAIFLKKTLF